MLKNADFLAKIGTDTAENERNFAEIVQIGRRVAAPCALATAHVPADLLSQGPAGESSGATNRRRGAGPAAAAA